MGCCEIKCVATTIQVHRRYTHTDRRNVERTFQKASPLQSPPLSSEIKRHIRKAFL